MTDINDFEIDESVIEQTSPEILDDELVEATERIAVAKERLLALCLARGYDGVDITFTQPKLSRQTDFRHAFEWEAWEGEPEPLEPYASNTQRYDFRGLRDYEKRELLAHVGIYNLEDIDND